MGFGKRLVAAVAAAVAAVAAADGEPASCAAVEADLRKAREATAAFEAKVAELGKVNEAAEAAKRTAAAEVAQVTEQLRVAKGDLATAGTTIADRDAAIASKDAAIATKDAAIAAKDAALKEKEQAAAGACRGLEQENAQLKDGRVKVAQELDAAQGQIGTLETSVKSCEARAETMAASAAKLSDAETEKRKLQAKIDQTNDECSAARKAAGSRQEKLENELSSCSSKSAHLAAELLRKSGLEYLFSFGQFRSVATSVYRLTRNWAAFSCATYVPAAVRETVSSVYDAAADVAAEQSVHGRILMGQVGDYVSPAAAAAKDFARKLPSIDLTEVRSRTHDVVEAGNRLLDEHVVDPFMAAYPDMKPLVPSSALDRIFFFIYDFLMLRVLLTLILHGVKLALCTGRMVLRLLGVVLCGCCCRRAGGNKKKDKSGKQAKGKDTKAEKEKPAKVDKRAAAADGKAAKAGPGKAN